MYVYCIVLIYTVAYGTHFITVLSQMPRYKLYVVEGLTSGKCRQQ